MSCITLLYFIGGLSLIAMIVSMIYGFLHPGEGHNYKPWEIKKLMFGDGDYINPAMEPSKEPYVPPEKPSFSNDSTQVNSVVED